MSKGTHKAVTFNKYNSMLYVCLLSYCAEWFIRVWAFVKMSWKSLMERFWKFIGKNVWEPWCVFFCPLTVGPFRPKRTWFKNQSRFNFLGTWFATANRPGTGLRFHQLEPCHFNSSPVVALIIRRKLTKKKEKKDKKKVKDLFESIF